MGVYPYLILLYAGLMIVIGVAGLVAVCVDCYQQYKERGCSFHHWRRHKIFESGVYWYFECFGCGQRDALKAHKGYSPVDQNWLNGGRRSDIEVYAPPDAAEPNRWRIEGPRPD